VAVGEHVPVLGVTMPQMMLISVVCQRVGGRASEISPFSDFQIARLSACKPEA